MFEYLWGIQPMVIRIYSHANTHNDTTIRSLMKKMCMHYVKLKGFTMNDYVNIPKQNTPGFRRFYLIICYVLQVMIKFIIVCIWLVYCNNSTPCYGVSFLACVACFFQVCLLTDKSISFNLHKYIPAATDPFIHFVIVLKALLLESLVNPFTELSNYIWVFPKIGVPPNHPF